MTLLDTSSDRRITARLDLDAKGTLAPHGIGGHARRPLESLTVRFEEIKESA
ncbi:hypothetical protein ABIC89_002400 [Variovorax boronicumulans]|uniref:hypothetical protein n=1 Tax=Variovorax boronicumulans TaxID=436515 RepID=UPI0033935AA0